MPQKYVQRCVSCTANTDNLSEIVQQNSYLLSLLQNRSLIHRGERVKAGDYKKDLEAAFYILVAKIISTERVFLGRAAKSFTVINITKDPQVFYRSNCLFNQRSNNWGLLFSNSVCKQYLQELYTDSSGAQWQDQRQLARNWNTRHSLWVSGKTLSLWGDWALAQVAQGGGRVALLGCLEIVLGHWLQVAMLEEQGWTTDPPVMLSRLNLSVVLWCKCLIYTEKESITKI